MFAGGVAVGDSGLVNGAGSGTANGPAASGDTSAADLALIGEAWKAIEDNYVDAKNLNTQDLAYAAIRGLATAVGDEGHTRFLTADELKATDQSLSGTFVGIGVQLDSDATKGATIQTVIPGTPAEAAGLKRGDKITAVDGQAHDRPDDRRGRVARPRTRGRGRHADHRARRRARRSTSRSSARSSTCRSSAGR